jgi:ribosomal protein S18 acetylase RimI-like enzyme
LPSTLSLRPLRRSDLAWFVEVRNSAREFLHDDRAFSAEDAESWFETSRPDYLIIELAGERAGYFRLEGLQGESGVLQVGADLARDLRGQGLGERIYRELLPELGDQYGARAFSLRVLPSNARAIRLYRKLGFTTHAVSARPAADRSIEIFDIEMRLVPEELNKPRTEAASDFADLLAAGLPAAGDS